MRSILKVVLEVDSNTNIALRLPALHGNVQEGSDLQEVLSQLASMAGSAGKLEAGVEELLLWSKVPFDTMSQVVQVLVNGGWHVISQHENHTRLHKST